MKKSKYKQVFPTLGFKYVTGYLTREDFRSNKFGILSATNTDIFKLVMHILIGLLSENRNMY